MCHRQPTVAANAGAAWASLVLHGAHGQGITVYLCPAEALVQAGHSFRELGSM